MNPVVSQSDIVTAYGWGIDALWKGLMSSRTAIRSSKRFAERGFVSDQLAMVPDLSVPPGESRSMAMLRRLLAPLAGQIDPQTPLTLATTVGEIEFLERAVLDESPGLADEARPAALLQRVKSLLGLTGPGMVLSSACASSATAIARAASMVRHEQAPHVLVVCCDAVSEFVYSGFSTLLSLCESPACPIDAERNGLTLGEAAGWALVTRDDSSFANDDGVAILGWGNTTDGLHMTAPDRNAGGLSRAIDKAMAMSHRRPGVVAFIAAHGTATVYSDAMEMIAFRRAMGDPKPTFSVKGGVGHTLAAAGLVQILVSARAMNLRVLPPTVGLTIPDASAAGWVFGVPVKLRHASVALSTNSGFGGVNTALVLGQRGGL
jgi:3-oxoacyl-[acyl-carrier-protein] synthase II